MKTSYLEYYYSEIAPVFQEVDLALKTAEHEFTVDEVADILMISPHEVRSIMKAKEILHIDNKNLIVIMAHGSSEACKLFAREKSIGSPIVYTRKDISYVYDLDIATVNTVCDSMGIKEVTSYTLPSVFSAIYMC